MTREYDGLRTFLGKCEEFGEIRTISGADWELEIGALTESTSELIPEPPALMFDEIKGYPKGFRVLSLPVASRVRTALALGLPTDLKPMELVREASRRVKNAERVPPKEVETGPVMQNVMRDNEVDLLKFPAIRAHKGDGGRYIGSGDTVINRDPDSGYVNMGTYRIQVHEKNLLGLWQSPGQQGRQIAERYWKKGKPCPVVATFGGDPLLFMASYTKFAWGVSELEGAGGIMGQPVEVIPGPLTGLPIPAHAEIAIEGEIPPPDVESREEGPYGEWTGYYAGGTLGTGEDQPVIRVKAIYYRDDPILLNMAPQWPGAPHHGVRFEGGILWDQLEAAGVAGVKGAYIHNAFLAVVAIEQRYAGHAKQTGMATLGCAAAARNGRFIVIVDDDIDPSNMKEVWWAMTSRCNPASDIDIIDNCWASPLDPRMPRDVSKTGPHVNSRAIVQAVRPWAWRGEFPAVNRIDADQREAVVEKFKELLPFPRM